jgi:putative FmdB family regulatory protein
LPIYEYECRKCGVFDYEQSIADRPLARCPRCRSKVTKLISATAFHLKGGGWYADGYDSKKAKADSEPKADSSASPDPVSSDKTPSVPAPAAAESGSKKKPAKSGRRGKTAAA